MVDVDWSDSWRGAFRIELRAEAIGLAWRGWPVLPGSYPEGSQWVGRDGARSDGPVPVHDDWHDRIGTAAEQVATWWADGPYSLLLATGVVLDAIEVREDLGRAAARELRLLDVPVPIVATPSGRWLFLTHLAEELRADLTGHPDVTVHSTGSWVPLPPSPAQHGVVHWRVRPEVCGWEFPRSHVVQNAIADALMGRTSVTSAQLVTVD